MLTWTSSERDHWSHGGEQKAEKDHLGLKSFCFSFVFILKSVCDCLSVCVWVCVCVCVRLHLKVLLCLHMWACVFVCICVVTPGPTPHERTPSDLWPFYSVAVWPLKSAWMSCYTPFSLYFPFRVLLPHRAQLDSAGYNRGLTCDDVAWVQKSDVRSCTFLLKKKKKQTLTGTPLFW